MVRSHVRGSLIKLLGWRFLRQYCLIATSPCPAMTVEEPAIDFIPEKKAGNQPSEPVPVEKRRGSMEGLIGLT